MSEETDNLICETVRTATAGYSRQKAVRESLVGMGVRAIAQRANTRKWIHEKQESELLDSEDKWSGAGIAVPFPLRDMEFYFSKKHVNRVLGCFGEHLGHVGGVSGGRCSTLAPSWELMDAAGGFQPVTFESTLSREKAYLERREREMEKRNEWRGYGMEQENTRRFGFAVPDGLGLTMVIEAGYEKRKLAMAEQGREMIPRDIFWKYREDEARRLARPDRFVVDTDGRMHSVLTWTCGIWRPFITVDGVETEWYDLDLQHAHPSLLPLIMRLDGKETELYGVLSEGKDVYNYMADRTGVSRPRAKVMFQRWINCPLWMHGKGRNEEVEMVDAIFPCCGRYVRSIKHDRGQLSVGSLLRKKEAEIFHGYLAPALLEAGVTDFFVIHDGIMVERGKRDAALAVMEPIIRERIGHWAQLVGEEVA